MKSILTISLSLLPALASLAQPATPDARTTHRKLVQATIQKQNKALAKTTEQRMRLKASSTYEHDGTQYNRADTSRYQYSGSRGSSFNLQQMAYVDYDNINPATDPLNYGRPEVHYDSLQSWENAGPNNLILHFDAHHVYNASGRSTEHMYYQTYNSPLDIGRRDLAEYDAQGRPVRLWSLQDDAGGWDSVSKRIFSFNNLNQAISDTLYTFTPNGWEPVMTNSYTFNAAGRLTEQKSWLDFGGGMQPFLKSQIFYDASGRVTNSLMSMATGGVFIPRYRDTLIYDAATSLVRSEQQWEWNPMTAVWTPSFKQDRHINSQGLPDTLRDYMWDTAGGFWDMYSEATYAFNSNKLPTVSYHADFDGGVRIPTQIRHYYYETYNVPSGLPQTTAASEVRIFPNPVTDQLQLQFGQSGARHMRLYNMAGQQVLEQSIASGATHSSISMGHLPAGNYALLLTDAAGKPLARQTIVRR